MNFGRSTPEEVAASRRRAGKRGIKQRILAGKQSPIKMHPAHIVTSQGIEIGRIAAATRDPDGTRRDNGKS